MSIRILKEKYRYVGRDHLFYFSSQNLRQMLARSGFSKIRSKTGGFNPIVCYQDAFGQTRKSWEERMHEDQSNEGRVRRLKTTRFLWVVHRVYYHFIEALRLGDTLFAEGVKE